jgi:hypothetical protein
MIKHRETAREWKTDPLYPKSLITGAGITEVDYTLSFHVPFKIKMPSTLALPILYG